MTLLGQSNELATAGSASSSKETDPPARILPPLKDRRLRRPFVVSPDESARTGVLQTSSIDVRHTFNGTNYRLLCYDHFQQ